MGKKKPEEMAKQRAVFLEGCENADIDRTLAGNIFDLVEKFAGYGFNKSHSAAYALLSYQTAWLKQHYPAAFMCAVLSADMDNTDKVVVLIEECASMGLAVRSPDINASEVRFNVIDEKTIRYGLGAIKGVGDAALTSVLQEREENGPFADLLSLCRRVNAGGTNKRVLEALIYAGACDGMGSNRATLMANLPQVMQSADQFHRDKEAGQDDLFGMVDDAPQSPVLDMRETAEWSKRELLGYEKDTLGLYLSDHPINEFLDELSCFVSGRIGKLCAKVPTEAPPGQQHRRPRGIPVVLAGLSIARRIRETSRGKMGFITLDDRSGRVDALLNADQLETYAELLGKDAVLIVEGDLAYDDFNRGYSIRAKEVYSLDSARARFARSLVINIKQAEWQPDALEKLLSTLSGYCSGRTPVYFEYVNGAATARIQAGNNWLINPVDELLDDLHKLAGKNAVQLQY